MSYMIAGDILTSSKNDSILAVDVTLLYVISGVALMVFVWLLL